MELMGKVKKNLVKKSFLFSILGIFLLSTLSILQKYSLGADPFTPIGFIVPVFFGAFSGYMFGHWLEKYIIANRIVVENERKLEAIFNSQLTAIIISDINECIIVELNKMAALLIGAEKEAILGLTCHNVFYKKVKNNYVKVDKYEDLNTSKIVIKNISGDIIPVLIHCEKVLIYGRNYMAISFMDISKEEKLESQLQISQKLEALGTLSGGIAHDFNNILLAISGHAEIAIAKIRENNSPVSNLESILKASEKAKDLIDRILLFSKPSGENMANIDVNDIISNLKDLMKGSLPVNIKMKIFPFNGNPVILGNYSQLYQAILNLISNAIFSMKENGGKLILKVEQVFQNDIRHLIPHGEKTTEKFIKISVIDTGLGIPDENLKRVFDPFFSTKPVNIGSGIGLSIVHRIVNNHEGYVNIESKTGIGTEVCIYLPKGDNLAIDKRDNILQKINGAENVLLIDDDKTVMEVINEILKKLGYNVTAFANGLKAIDHFKKNAEKYDIVISDQIMPEISGLEIAKKIRKINERIPFVIITGKKNMFHEETLKDSGIDIVIPKPFRMEKFSQKIREILDLKKIN